MNKTILLIILGIIGLISISACTPVQECPQLTCPICKAPNTPIVSQKAMVFTYFMDIGHGDATLIKSGETEMLIDCGKNSVGPAVVDFLKLKQVGDLEYLMITHPDSEHLGGCDDVLKAFKVHSLITNGESSELTGYTEVMAELDTEQHIIASKGNAWNIGPAEMRIIQANNGLTDSDQNSIVSKLTYGTMDILLTGDCIDKCEDTLLNNDIQSEILKVAGHGTKYATDTDFLELVKPQAAIIQTGTNSYGHPADETLDRLNQEGILIYKTDIEGDITVSLTGESYEIIT